MSRVQAPSLAHHHFMQKGTHSLSAFFAELNKDLDPSNTHGQLYELSYRHIFGTGMPNLAPPALPR
jgi:hypothetical protein